MSTHGTCDTDEHLTEWAEARGEVSAVFGDLVDVSIAHQGCGKCHEPGGCGGQNLTQMLAKPKTFTVPNTIGAKVGDKVVVMSTPTLVRQAAWQAYALPWLLCIVAASIGQWLSGDTGAMLGGVIGLLLGWLSLRQKVLVKDQVHPQLLIRFDVPS